MRNVGSSVPCNSVALHDLEEGLSCNSAGERLTYAFAIAHLKSPIELCAQLSLKVGDDDTPRS